MEGEERQRRDTLRERLLAQECDLPLLGQVPLDPRIQEGGDTGRPIVDAEPESKAAKVITQVATRVIERLVARYG